MHTHFLTIWYFHSTQHKWHFNLTFQSLITDILHNDRQNQKLSAQYLISKIKWDLATCYLILSLLIPSRADVCSLSRRVLSWPCVCYRRLMTTRPLETHHRCQRRATGNALATGLPMESFRENRPRLLLKETESDSCMNLTHTHKQTASVCVNHLACFWQLNESKCMCIGFSSEWAHIFQQVYEAQFTQVQYDDIYFNVVHSRIHFIKTCEMKISQGQDHYPCKALL